MIGSMGTLDPGIAFVKGHCGWDTLTLVPLDQIAVGHQIETALKIIDTPINGGLEVGFLGVGDSPDEILVKMVNSTTRTWIPMCGGMTQVIGKAIVETFFRDMLNVDINKPQVQYRLITDSGPIPIVIDIDNQRVQRVTTNMDNYLVHLYQQGIEPLTIQSVVLLRVGKYIIFDIAELVKAHPAVDFTRRDTGDHLTIINSILQAYCDRQGIRGVNGMLFDQSPEAGGQFRVYPRFYSQDQTAANIPWEFQCGTGTVAVGAALAFYGLLSEGQDQDEASVIFEWGNYQNTPDPYGIRTSILNFSLSEGKLTSASFSHSVVEIVAEGLITLPSF